MGDILGARSYSLGAHGCRAHTPTLTMCQRVAWVHRALAHSKWWAVRALTLTPTPTLTLTLTLALALALALTLALNQARALVAGLLTRDPAKRTGLTEIAASAWLSSSLKRFGLELGLGSGLGLGLGLGSRAGVGTGSGLG